MALSLRGTAENSGIDGADLSITLPAGVAEDDGVWLAYAEGTNSDVDMAMVTTGYTELADLNRGPSIQNNLGVFRKIMGATPDSTATCDGHGDAGAPLVAVCQVWTGADTTTPEDATSTTATADAGDPDSPSITTVTDGAVVISFGSTNANDGAVTAPSGYSDQVDVGRTDSASATVGAASITVASAGPENPASWTNWSGAVFPRHCAVTVAVRPGGGGAPAATEPANVSVTFTLATCGAGR